MEIIYEDGQILVCKKEAGLPVQSGRVQTMDLESMLRNHLRENHHDGKEPYLGIVHRLDQPVEGLLVFAKTKKAAASLSAQVQDGRMEKIYLAVAAISGGNLPDEGVLENWLVRAFCSAVRYRAAGRRPWYRFICLRADIIRSGCRWPGPGCPLWEIGNTGRQQRQKRK